MNVDVIKTNGDSSGTIDSLIGFLQEAKLKGATHYKMDWSKDPTWAFKWFQLYRIKSDDELKQDEIKNLEERLLQLKG